MVEQPLVLGHEAGGVIVGVGPGVPDDRLGQRVSLEPGIPCRHCRVCLSGRYNLCPQVRFFATPPVDGAFCDYVVLPSSFAYAVPDVISDDAAGLIEPLSVAVWACRRAGVTAGSRVLVTGAGPIGLCVAQAAQAFGATEVMVTDVNAARLAMAGSLGATALDVSQTAVGDQGYDPDVLIECSGHPGATVEAIRAVAPAGHVVLVGIGSEEIPLPLSYVQDREITLTGAFRYAGTWPTAIALAASEGIDLDVLVTGHYRLDEVEQALTAPHRNPRTVKPVVVPHLG